MPGAGPRWRGWGGLEPSGEGCLKSVMSSQSDRREIGVGRCYSNGVFGRNWQVRQVVALDADAVVYKVLVGPDRRRRQRCTLEEFVNWIGHEVRRNENSWVRMA